MKIEVEDSMYRRISIIYKDQLKLQKMQITCVKRVIRDIKDEIKGQKTVTQG